MEAAGGGGCEGLRGYTVTWLHGYMVKGLGGLGSELLSWSLGIAGQARDEECLRC